MKIIERVGTCEWCGVEYAFGKKITRYCSHKCAAAFSAEKKRLLSQEEFLIEHGHDENMPVCKECGWKAFDLTTHITKFHKILMKDYYKKYSCDSSSILHEERRLDRSQRKQGDKNPFYNHGGKYSHISKNCIDYEGLSEEETNQRIKEIQKKQADGRENGEGYTTRLEYWINKGFSEDEAKIQLKNRQRTFSLDICIMKYGQEAGMQRWKERQTLWLKSYNDKTDEEMQDIFRRKNIFTKGTSKPAVALFTSINHPTAKFEDMNDNHESAIATVLGKKYSVDFCVHETKKIIEYYGDVWHGNPLMYEAEEQPIFWSIHSKTAEQMWASDKAKTDDLINSGYEVMVVWGYDYLTDQQATIQKCKDFLGI